MLKTFSSNIGIVGKDDSKISINLPSSVVTSNWSRLPQFSSISSNRGGNLDTSGFEPISSQSIDSITFIPFFDIVGKGAVKWGFVVRVLDGVVVQLWDPLQYLSTTE